MAVALYTGLHLVHQGMKMEHLAEEFDGQWRYQPDGKRLEYWVSCRAPDNLIEVIS